MRAVCIGELIIDYISSQLGSLEQASLFVRCAGGSAANTAVGLHALGTHVALCSKVGNDLMGAVAIREMEDVGLPTTHIKIDTAKPTKCSFISHDETGRRFIDVVNRNSADQQLGLEDVLPALQAPFSLLHISGVMLLSSQGLELILQCLEHAKHHDALISFDPVFDLQRAHESVRNRMFDILPHCNIVKLNDAEFQAISHRMNQEDINPPIVIHTLGQDGARIICGTSSVHIPAQEAKTVDPTGAGDAFFSGFLAAMLKAPRTSGEINHESLQQWGLSGVQQAAHVIEHVGGITYYKHDGLAR